jgi:orotate phosphoribosyltransferase
MTQNNSGHYAYAIWNNETLDNALEDISIRLQNVDYDCFIGRGISGMVMAAHCAREFNKELVIVRKNEEHHGSPIEGFTDFKKGIIIDDFMSSGNTIVSILNAFDNPTRIVGILLYGERPPSNILSLKNIGSVSYRFF